MADNGRVLLCSEGLRDANLSNANLFNADLIRTQALNTNFEGATLTGAWIEDWNINKTSPKIKIKINKLSILLPCSLFPVPCSLFPGDVYSRTNLVRVVCKYVYLASFNRDRRPHDPDRNFALGEFAQIFQKVHETLDLYFRDGVDWQAAAYSFQSITTVEHQRDRADRGRGNHQG